MTNHILNLFPVENLTGLSCDYRLLEISNLPKDTQYAENVSRLATIVSKETRKPVSVYKQDGVTYLATTHWNERLSANWRLTPHVAVLTLLEERGHLDFGALEAEQVDLALNLLRYDIRTALANAPELWNDNPNSFYKRTGTPIPGTGDEVELLDGFFFSLHRLPDGKIYVAVDPTVKYADPLSFAERLKRGANGSDFKFKHFIYKNPRQPYRVQFMGLAGNSISKQLFVHNNGDTHYVYDWITKTCPLPVPDFIQELDPESPAILYRYATGGKHFHGAAALCFKTYHPEDARVRGLHSGSLMQPGERLEETKNIVRRYFRNIRFAGGGSFSFSGQPFTKAAEHFDVPDLLYAKGKVLHVRNAGESEGVSLSEYPRKRLEFLQKQIGGVLAQDGFPMQYMFVPTSLHRSIVKEFMEDFVDYIQKVCEQGYSIKTIVYDDRWARNLRQQVVAIKKAVADNRIDRGRALLILPENADRDLHNYIKRELYQTLHFQCAQASSIKRYFLRDGNNYQVRSETTGKYLSYIRYTAIGLLLVNRKWPFALKAPLNYDLPFGIDVLNSMAGFTYAYNGGKDARFEPGRSTQGEKLTKNQVMRMLYRDLKRDLPALGIRPKALVQQRDGNTHPEEIEGMALAVRRLQSDGLLDLGITVGTVKVHKSSASHLRLYEEDHGQIRNPTIGSYFLLSDRQGIVCNTGFPFNFKGTVKPLLITVVEGELEILKVLSDVFALAQLAWTAPDRPARQPITTKLGDMFLRPIASAADEESALYGEENDNFDDQGEEVVNLDQVLLKTAAGR